MRINLAISGKTEEYLSKFPEKDRASVVRFILLKYIEKMEGEENV